MFVVERETKFVSIECDQMKFLCAVRTKRGNGLRNNSEWFVRHCHLGFTGGMQGLYWHCTGVVQGYYRGHLIHALDLFA
jgi:hypothetical protein